MNVTGAGPGFGVHIVDVEVDKEAGGVRVVRYTVVADAGKAIHPLQVEGQYQGGAVQGVGWALNEEYIYGEDGRLQNPSFLDYRIPVACPFRKFHPAWIRVPWQNRRIMKSDAYDPSCPWKVPRRPVQVAQPA